jgi:hypothetical protein
VADTSAITGRVTDPGGYPIANTNVTAMGTPRGAASDQDGRFTIADLSPATYSLVFSHIGYITDTLRVTVEAEETTTLLVVLHEDVLELQGVELVLQRESLNDQATSGRIIFRQQEVSALPGGNEDPLRALTLVPGITARDPDDGDWSVRGADMDEMRVILDGIPVPRPTHFGLLSRSLSIFNPLVTDRFELWKGGMPASFGRALGGTLLVESKDTDTDELRGALVLTYLAANLGWEVPFTESIRWVNGVRLNYDPGIYRFLEQTMNDRYVRPTLRDAQGSLRLDAGENHRFRLTYLLSSDRLESIGALGSFDHSNRLYAGGLGWSWVPKSGWFSHIVAYGWQTRETLRQLDRRSETNWTNTRIGIRGENTVLITPGGQFRAGGVIEGEDGDRRDPVAKTEFEETITDLYYAVFLEGRIRWGRLHTTAGVRADFYDWWLYDEGTLTNAAYHMYRINPRVTLGFYLTQHLVVKGYWGTFTQPRDTVLYEATHWSLGVEVRHRGWSGEVTGYLHNRDRDYEGIRRYANGIEILLRRRVGPLTGWIGASLSVSEREAKNMLEPTAMDRRWTILGALMWNATPVWRLSSEMFFGTGFPYEPVSGRVYLYSGQTRKIVRGWYPTYGPFGSARLPEVFRLDVKAAHDIVIWGVDATIFAEVINVTAHPNVVDYLWSDDIRIREEIREFPTFLPLLGLEVRF